MSDLNPTFLLTETDCVILIKEKDDEGRIVPKGTKGTVVHVYRAMLGYEVEFSSSINDNITVEPNEIIKDVPPIRFSYTNYRGEQSIRNVVVIGTYVGSTEWHPEEGILLKAFDLDKQEIREFALKDCDFTKTE